MLGLSWYLWAVLALIPAGIFLFIRPQPHTNSYGGSLVLHYGHSVVWLLLSLSCLCRAWQFSGAAQLTSLLAGLIYAGFILAVVKNKP